MNTSRMLLVHILLWLLLCYTTLNNVITCSSQSDHHYEYIHQYRFMLNPTLSKTKIDPIYWGVILYHNFFICQKKLQIEKFDPSWSLIDQGLRWIYTHFLIFYFIIRHGYFQLFFILFEFFIVWGDMNFINYI